MTNDTGKGMTMPRAVRIGAAPVTRNTMSVERAVRNASMMHEWPEGIKQPKLKADRDLAIMIYTNGLGSRPMDEWVMIDLMELARYSKLLVQLNKAQDELAMHSTSTKAYADTMRAVGQLNGMIQAVGRKLYLHKVVMSMNGSAAQTKVEREIRSTLNSQPGPDSATGRPRPQLLA